LAQCPSPSCTPPFVQTALNAAAIGTGTVGFITTATVTFCTSAVSQVFLSGDSTLNGGISIDDMLVYQLDANGVIGLGFAGTCSATGFLSIGAGSVTQAAVSSHGAPILLGTVSAGTHTLLIGTYNCGGGGFNSLINIVGCSLTSCTTTTTTTTATTTTATTTSSATTTPAVTGSSCFHESTLITYQGKEYSLQELQGNVAVAECRVPHVVRSSKGVIIETSCSKQGKEQLLHLTEDHLVLTSKLLRWPLATYSMPTWSRPSLAMSLASPWTPRSKRTLASTVSTVSSWPTASRPPPLASTISFLQPG
jgi:hypothetical protein